MSGPDLLQWLAGWPGAAFLRRSSAAYLFVNAAHILGIGLILGAILPLDLRLMGLVRAPPVAAVGPFLSRAAACGVVLAVLSGFWLFTVRPVAYIGNQAFLIEIALLAAAIANLGFLHMSGAWRAVASGAPAGGVVRFCAFLSFSLWLAALLAGRWIGFL
ncbi:DUF2214 domain-containing protein [Pararhizobium sp. A13]|uniref:DUF2214 domain-containing protein n=1 Tax=Pararhizobium sp. A13 TaxID=3133975 RepID=UPI0032495187